MRTKKNSYSNFILPFSSVKSVKFDRCGKKFFVCLCLFFVYFFFLCVFFYFFYYFFLDLLFYLPYNKVVSKKNNGRGASKNLTNGTTKKDEKMTYTKQEFIQLARQVAQKINSTDTDRVLNNYYMNSQTARETIAHFGENVVRGWLDEFLPMCENEYFYNI